MHREVGVESEVATQSVPTWAQPVAIERDALEWQSVDRALRTLHGRRCGLDAEEARWLRAAEALQIWRPLGMVSAIDYMERVLGYAPRTAKERLRVARALGDLPLLDGALARGELPYSAARELTRVATPDNEDSWIAGARDLNLREIEGLVADRKPGDRPTDPRDPTARVHVVRLELSAETFALLRQTRQVLDDEHGTNITEDQLIAAMCQAVRDGQAPGEPDGRAKFQIAVTVCERCQQGWQHGAGAKVPISAAAVERARCDAQHIGSIDDETPARAYQDVSPSVARFVWHRDAGRCHVPGCRSARGLEVHHIVHRADGGSHEASNLTLLCSSCHQAHHAGRLSIAGTAAQLEVRRPQGAIVERASGIDSPRAEGRAAAVAAPAVAAPAVTTAGAAASATTTAGAAASATTTAGAAASATTTAGAAASAITTAPIAKPADTTAGSAASEGTIAGGAAAAVPASARPTRAQAPESASCGTHVGLGMVHPDDGVGRSDEAVKLRDGAGHPDAGAGRPAAGAGRSDAGVSRSDASLGRSRGVSGSDASAPRPSPLARSGNALTAWEVTRFREDAKQALIQLGWKSGVARAAVDGACRDGAATTLEQLLFEACKRCARLPS